MPDMTDEEAIALEMERQEAATEQDLLDRIADAFGRADKGAEVEAVWPLVEAELGQRAEQAKAALAEMTALRDNAVRAAEHADQSIDVDLDGLIGDGLAALGWEWDNEISDLAPPKLVDAIVDLVRPVVAHAVKRAEQAERDALKSALAEQTQRTLNAAADKLYALPATDGAALKGPYWYRQGFTQAADLLRDWADYPAALDQLTEETPDA